MTIVKTFQIDMSTPLQSARGLLKMHIETLESFRGSSTKPEELKWEIRVYEFMLEDPVKRLDDWNRIRHRNAFRPLPKREVVKILGWSIP